MSIQQGLISPPLSGRTYKADQPRVQNIHKAVNAADVFGPVSSATSSARPAKTGLFEYHHTIRSPVKKHDDKVADADRPLTPPMSKDVRHDQHAADHSDPTGHYRTDSEGDHFDTSAASSSSAAVETAHHLSSFAAPASKAGLMAAAPIGNRFNTLNQGIEVESDDEHNPFLDRRPSKSSASANQAHHSHPYYDEFDSDQDAEGSVDDDDTFQRNADHDATPRASASSSNATTPPPAPRQAPTYRPARPFSERVRVNNEAVTSTVPIRDTPKNPFLAGGPADNGFHGPNRHAAYRRAQQIPGKERGKIAYVFRGQRVTYADPEYDSEDDDSELDEMYAKTNEFNPHHNPERPPRLQPKLLFPPNMSISEPQAGSSRARSSVSAQPVQQDGRRSHAATAYPERAVEVLDDEFGGATSSSSYNEEESYAPHHGGGLFAAQIAAQRKQQRQTAAPSYNAHSRQSDLDQQQYEEQSHYQHRHTVAAPSSSTRLQSITRDDQEVGRGADNRQAARDALLARLDSTNWSDDDEDDDERAGDFGRRTARGCREDTAAEEEQQRVQAQQFARSQGHRKRLSEHELQAGYAGEVDVLGRPMKRSRASYAY